MGCFRLGVFSKELVNWELGDSTVWALEGVTFWDFLRYLKTLFHAKTNAFKRGGYLWRNGCGQSNGINVVLRIHGARMSCLFGWWISRRGHGHFSQRHQRHRRRISIVPELRFGRRILSEIKPSQGIESHTDAHFIYPAREPPVGLQYPGILDDGSLGLPVETEAWGQYSWNAEPTDFWNAVSTEEIIAIRSVNKMIK